MSNKVLVVVAIVILAALGYQYWNREVEEVKVGVMAPLSGDFASFGEDIRAGILDASLSDVSFIFEDDKCDNPGALNAFKKLSELDRVSYIIGPGCGGPQEIVAPLLKEKGILALVPYAATEKLFDASGGKMYQIQYSLENEAKFIAEKMYELGHRRVALIWYKNPFSEVHANSFKANYQGTIAKELSLTEGASVLSTELLQLRNLNLDAVFSTDALFVIENGPAKLKELGIDIPLFSQYAVELPFLRPLAEGVIYSFPKDIPGDRGAIYGLARESVEFLDHLVAKCGKDTACAKQELDSSGDFASGIRARELVLKRIVNGEPQQY